MKTQKTIEEKFEGVMHMLINFGEQKSYKDEIFNEATDLMEEHFYGDRHLLMTYVNALIAKEVLDHLDVYTQYLEEDANVRQEIAEYIKEVQTIFENIIRGIL